MKAWQLFSIVSFLILTSQGREIKLQCDFTNPLLRNICKFGYDNKEEFKNKFNFDKYHKITYPGRNEEEILNNEPFIRCTYQFLTSIDVSCLMTIYNPQDNFDFERIEGNLPPIATYNQVTYVWAIQQHTTNIPNIICIQFPQLTFLEISSSRLNTINQNSFTSCNNLQNIVLNSNEISTIPDNTFGSNLRNIFSISLSLNQLTTISSRTFSTEVLTILNTFQADSNLINSIDSNWFNSTTNLVSLNLINNLCVNQNFENVNLNRIEVRDNLTICFNNYENVETTTETTTTTTTTTEPTTTTTSPDGSFIRCDYTLWGDEITCDLSIFNLHGNNFATIEGTLPPGTSYNQVTSVIAIDQLSINIPSIICRQFPQLSLLRIQSSQISIINQESFEACQNLFEMFFANNNITELGSNIFGNNLTNLGIIDLGMNQITRLSLTSFGSESIANLITVLLDSNSIVAIDPNWFDSAINLENLDLSFNLCTSQYFSNVNQNREQVRGALMDCFDNYTGIETTTTSTTPIQPDQDFIRCNYELWGENSLHCELTINNPNGRNDFNSIEGLLPPNSNFDQVSYVNSMNQLTTNIPSIICQQFSQLSFLRFFNSRITTINHETFSSCNNLSQINLVGNNISHIPDLTFGSNLRNIEIIDLGRNQLETLSARSFAPEVLSFLLELFSNFNFINAIDPNWFDSTVNLNRLDLQWNLCVDQNFENIHMNRQQVRNALTNCFNNYEGTETTILPDDSFIRCDYNFRQMNETFCLLNIHNPNGRNDFSQIEGNLPNGVTYDRIRYVHAVSQWTSNIPTIICQQFRQLQSLGIWASGVTYISRESFQFCDNVYEILLGFNEISHIPPETFGPTMWNLRNINFGYNKLSTLGLDSFSSGNIGSLMSVYLEFNSIEAIDANWFDSTQNLTLLDFRNNLCANQIFFDIHINRQQVRNQLTNCFDNYDTTETTTISPNNEIIQCEYGIIQFLFCNLTINNPKGRNDFNFIEGVLPPSRTYDEVFIVIINQQLTKNIPSIICRSFLNLQIFIASDSKVFTINQQSFEHCNNLSFLYLSSNKISEIPSQTFGNNLKNLRFLDVRDNYLRNISSQSFGIEFLESLETFAADGNQINAIDSQWFDSATNLTSLRLERNVCSNQNFIDINLFRQQVRAELADCFINFNLLSYTIKCEYSFRGDNLRCDMILVNPSGRNDLFKIEGTLPPNTTNNDVTTVSIFRQNTLNVPTIICKKFSNIQVLLVDYSNLEIINSQSFIYCDKLELLYMFSNNISHIPDETFGSNLKNLRLIDFGFNSITTLSSRAFSSEVLSSLMLLHADTNKIDAIDRLWFDSAINLNILQLIGNQCVSERFENVYINRQQVQNQLEKCFENYDKNTQI